jgi:putative PEP-CTERM system TPR-repeat lipoprotein
MNLATNTMHATSTKGFPGVKPVLVLAVAAVLAGCSPKPEELLARATASLEKNDVRSALIDLKALVQKDPQNAKARALLGEAYVLTGDVIAADIELKKAKDLGAPVELTLVPSCRVLVGQSKYAEAVEQCRPEAGSAAQKVDLLNVQGSALLGLERGAEARPVFEQALQAEPDNLEALLGLATAAQQSTGLKDALAVLDAGTDKAKQENRFWLARANVNIGLGDFPAAIKDFNTAFDKSTGAPDSVERLMALGGLAEAQMRAGDVKAADATTERLMKVAPNLPLAKQLRGQVAAAGGKTDEARTLLEEVVAGQPENTQARTLLAIVNMQQGNFDQAQMHLQNVVANEPGNARAQRLLAEVRARLGSPADSLASVQDALDATKNSPEMLAMAGRMSLASGDRAQALTYLAAAAQQTGANSDPQTLLEVANSYLAAGEVDRAMEVLQGIPEDGLVGRQRDSLMLLSLLRKGDRAKLMEEAKAVVARNPKDATVRNTVGGIYAATGQADLAREQFAEATRLAPKEAAGFVNLARIELAQGKTDAAEGNLRRALENDPKNLPAMLGLAVAASTRKDTKATEKFLLQARDAHPESVEAQLGLAQFYLQNNDAAKARAVADAAVSANPKSAAMANLKGLVLLNAKDVPGATASFAEAVRLEPKSVGYVRNLANAKFVGGDVPGGFAVIDDALRGEPRSAPMLTVAATAALQVNQAEKAAGYVARLREVAPDTVSTLVLEGDLAMTQKRYKDAVGFYRKAQAGGSNSRLVLAEYRAASLAGEANALSILDGWLARNPGDVEAATLAAETRRNRGDPAGAIAVYEAALAKLPDNLVIINNLAVLHETQGNLARAAEYAGRAYKAAPKAPAIVDTYGWILFRQGKTAEALPLLREAHKGLPDNAEVQYHLAVALASKGDKTEAAALLRKATAGTLPADKKADAEKLLKELAK